MTFVRHIRLLDIYLDIHKKFSYLSLLIELLLYSDNTFMEDKVESLEINPVALIRGNQFDGRSRRKNA